MKVKICGIMEAKYAIWAAEAGADFLGFVLAPGRRRVTPEQARSMADCLGAAGLRDRLGLVGVFVNESEAIVNETAELIGLDFVQLSGDESWEYLRRIERPVIKAIKLAPGVSCDDTLAGLKGEWDKLGDRKFAVIVEPLIPGSYGGAGKQLDWESLGDLSETLPVILAGGLNPENVERACKLVKPWGVDVSSGVESHGVKDEVKIKAFVVAARSRG